jgi:hypothetical protein
MIGNKVSKYAFEKFEETVARGSLLFALEFLPVFFGEDSSLFDIEAFVVAIGLEDGFLEINMFTDGLEVGHDFPIVSDSYAGAAGDDEGEGEGVDVAGAVVSCKDALPETESFEKLELLAEEERDPAKGVVEGVDAECFEALPGGRPHCLSGRTRTSSIVVM